MFVFKHTHSFARYLVFTVHLLLVGILFSTTVSAQSEKSTKDLGHSSSSGSSTENKQNKKDEKNSDKNSANNSDKNSDKRADGLAQNNADKTADSNPDKSINKSDGQAQANDKLVQKTEVVSEALAVAAKHVVTSREVKISNIIDQALAMPAEASDKEAKVHTEESEDVKAIKAQAGDSVPSTATKDTKANERESAKDKKRKSNKGNKSSVGEKDFSKDQWLLSDNSPDMQKQLAQVLLEIMVSAEAENFSIGQVDSRELEAWQKHLDEQVKGWAPWKKLEVQADELNQILHRKMRAKNFLKFKMEASGVTVSDDEVKAYYEKNLVKFGNLPFSQFRDSIREKLKQEQTQERLKDWFDILKRKYQVRLLGRQSS